jgi:hypothetical protein
VYLNSQYSGGCHSGNKYHTKCRNQDESAQFTEKVSGEIGAGNPYTYFTEIGNSKVCLRASKDTTWLKAVACGTVFGKGSNDPNKQSLVPYIFFH